MQRARNVLWGLILAGLGVLGSGLLLLFSQPFARARAWVDPLAKDGSFELFSPAFYQSARLPALILGGLCLLLLASMLIWRRQSLALVGGLVRLPGRAFARLRSDAPRFMADLRQQRLPRREALLLLGLVLLALVARGAFLWRPPEHDEVYTVINFAAPPLHVGLVDYHLPNNHVFHTLLLHFLFLIFGYPMWAMRLVAYLAGVLVVPVLYFLARWLYDQRTAALAAASAAVLPVLVYYGTNARGYTLLMLFMLLIMLLAEYVRRHANLLAWGLWVLFAALGLFTVPVFLYAFGIVGAWLLVAVLLGDGCAAYGSRWRMLKWLVIAGASVAALTMLFYTPVFLHSGIRAVFANPTIAPIPWSQFPATLHDRLLDTYGQYAMDVPLAGQALFVLGFVLSLTPLATRLSLTSGRRFPWQVVAPLVIATLLLIQRPNPWGKIWTFLIPLLLMWGAAGLVGLLNAIQHRLGWRWNLAGGFAGLVLIAAVVGTGLSIANSPNAGFNIVGPEEKITLFLRDQVQPTDLIVVAPPQDALVWYYSHVYEIDMNHYKRELPFFRSLVVVDTRFSQTPQSVIEDRGPEPYFYRWDTAQMIKQIEYLQVYQIEADADLVRKEYHLP